ncbi:acyl coA binding protein [Sarocladium implicatum]|nr:acyl coA binding protein [Sarocladium implicatum]
MEGDVDGVMARPSAASPSGTLTSEEVQRERDKWDAWNSQKGLTRTDAKKRYIEALIDTMHRYATTPDAEELVSELEFVWNQIRDNAASSNASSPQTSPPSRRFQEPTSGTEGPMKVLSPMSEQDEADRRSHRQMDLDDDDDDDDPDGGIVDRRRGSSGNSRWQRKVEQAITSLSAEVAALREQISSGPSPSDRPEIPLEFPPLVSIAPAVFLPITRDFTKPIAPIPSATTSRLRNTIDRHHTHTKAVADNIMDYYIREAVRQSQLPPAPLPPSATPYPVYSQQDRDQLIANVEAPLEPGKDIHVDVNKIEPPEHDKLPSQELRLLATAVRDLTAYQQHASVKAQRLREEYKRAQEREAA